MDLSSFASLASTPIDIIILVSASLVLGVIASRMGLNMLISIAIGLPLAQFATALMAESAFIGNMSDPASASAMQAGVFVVTAVILTGLVHRMTSTYGDMGPSFPLALLGGFATTIVVITVWMTTPALFALWEPGSLIQVAFAAEYRLWWLMGAYLGLAYVRT